MVPKERQNIDFGFGLAVAAEQGDYRKCLKNLVFACFSMI
jgi:hypothetical protein